MSYPSIEVAAHALRTGKTTSQELVADSFRTIADLDPTLAAFVDLFRQEAMAAAFEADRERAAGLDRGPLHGIPLGVKDIVRTREGITRAQSVVLDPSWSAPGDAPAVERLRAAGAVIVGKTSTMEFALGFPESDDPFPRPRNPWNTDHWTGGSSSGTASAIASGMVLGGLGTDTGGSVRFPAANCGVSGLKPTFGRVPNRGVVPLGFTLDHVGPLARTAADCGILLDTIAGFDPLDGTSADRPTTPSYVDEAPSLEGRTVGVALLDAHTRSGVPELAEVFASAVAVLEGQGARAVPVELPHYELIRDVVAMTGSLVEAYAYHRNDLAQRWNEYGRSARIGFVTGALVSGGDYVQMQRVRRVAQRGVARLFRDVDLIVTPTIARGAEPFGGFDFAATVDAMHTAYWNAMSNPALSVPMGFTHDRLPLGMQIVGRPFAERSIVDAGRVYQTVTEHHLQRPPVVAEEMAR